MADMAEGTEKSGVPTRYVPKIESMDDCATVGQLGSEKNISSMDHIPVKLEREGSIHHAQFDYKSFSPEDGRQNNAGIAESVGHIKQSRELMDDCSVIGEVNVVNAISNISKPYQTYSASFGPIKTDANSIEVVDNKIIQFQSNNSPLNFSEGQTTVKTEFIQQSNSLIQNNSNEAVSSLIKTPIQYRFNTPVSDTRVPIPIFESKKFRCRKCPLKFIDYEDHRTHLTSHFKVKFEGPIECRFCCETFRTWTLLKAHEENGVHSPLKCEICSQTFTIKSRLKDHKMHHYDAQPFACKTCGKRYKERLVLKRHLRSHSGSDIFHCRKCHIKFVDYEVYRAHLTSHFKTKFEGAIECRSCCETFKTWTLKKVHEENGVHSPLQCDVCSGTFKLKAWLKAHKMRHYDAQPFACKICGKRYKERSGLKQHFRIHSLTPQDLLHCAQCGKPFLTKNCMIKHLMSHSNECPYHCIICNKRLKTEKTLREHMLLHSDLRPFECKQCDMKCKTKALLSFHMKSHSSDRPYECSACGKRFKTRHHISQHLVVHLDVWPYKCPDCDKVFKWKAKMMQHRQSHSMSNESSSKLEGERALKIRQKTHLLKDSKLDSNSLKSLSSNGSKSKAGLKKRSSKINSVNHLKPIIVDNMNYECNECSSTFKRKRILISHLKTHCINDSMLDSEDHSKTPTIDHEKEDIVEESHDTYYECNECSSTFKRKRVLISHLKTHNSMLGSEDHSKTHAIDCEKGDIVEKSHLTYYECNECSSTFIRKSGLMNHLKTHNSILDSVDHSKSHPIDNAKRDIFDESHDSHYACNECSSTFKRKRVLINHLKTHNAMLGSMDHSKSHPIENANSAVLPVSNDVIYNGNGDLENHVENHSSQDLRRDIIDDTSFLSEESHKMTHNCDICKNQLHSRNNLLNHWETHACIGSSRKEGDEQINPSHLQASSLIEDPLHINQSSSGNVVAKQAGLFQFTRYVMPENRIAPSSANNISNADINRNKSETQFVQLSNGKKYKSKRTLRSQRQSAPIFKCYDCILHFASVDELQKHLDTHSDEESYEDLPKRTTRGITGLYGCSDCSLRFESINALADHLKIHSAESITSTKLTISPYVQLTKLRLNDDRNSQNTFISGKKIIARFVWDRFANRFAYRCEEQIDINEREPPAEPLGVTHIELNRFVPNERDATNATEKLDQTESNDLLSYDLKREIDSHEFKNEQALAEDLTTKEERMGGSSEMTRNSSLMNNEHVIPIQCVQPVNESDNCDRESVNSDTDSATSPTQFYESDFESSAIRNDEDDVVRVPSKECAQQDKSNNANVNEICFGNPDNIMELRDKVIDKSGDTVSVASNTRSLKSDFNQSSSAIGNSAILDMSLRTPICESGIGFLPAVSGQLWAPTRCNSSDFNDIIVIKNNNDGNSNESNRNAMCERRLGVEQNLGRSSVGHPSSEPRSNATNSPCNENSRIMPTGPPDIIYASSFTELPLNLTLFSKQCESYNSGSQCKEGENFMIPQNRHREFFTCAICKRHFTCKTRLKNHIMMHYNIRPFKCNKCSKSFVTGGELSTHMITHSDEARFKCSQCSKRFKYSMSLRSHMSVHTNLKPYACSVCGKRFKTKGTLGSHKLKHSSDKLYHCDVCGRSLTTRGGIIVHLQSHSIARPHKCLQCPKRFKNKITLNSHMAVHTEETPFECGHCSKKCKTKARLQNHLVSHSSERPHECSACGKKFKLQIHLVQHAVVHFDEWPFKCPDCDKRFKWKSKMNQHQKTHNDG